MASQSERGDIDHLTLLKNFDEKIVRPDGANSSADTNANTLVQNSQNTANLSQNQMHQSDANSLRKNLFGAIKNIPKNPNPFGANLTHINHIDNTLMEKLPKVEYDFDDGFLPVYT